jgi:hypothetical protein
MCDPTSSLALTGGTAKNDALTTSDLPPKRLNYIDNLRSSMVFLVVTFHTAITYSHIGSWYYSEPGQDDPVSAVTFAWGGENPPLLRRSI